MKKIKTLFIRNAENPKLVTKEIEPDCYWVINGEGISTIKKDGTNIRVTVKCGKEIHIEKRKNPTREEKKKGEIPTYIDANRKDPADKHIYSAVDATDFSDWPDGKWSCEALGPKIQGGKESNVPKLYPFSFNAEIINVQNRTFDGIKEFLTNNKIEGIVWHHKDGRMAKIKRRDFGLDW